MIKPKVGELAPKPKKNSWTIWLSSGIVICALVFSTILLMVKPACSLSQYQPLVRQRELQHKTNTDGVSSVGSGSQQLRVGAGADPLPESGPDDVNSEADTDNGHNPTRRKAQQSQEPNAMNFVPFKHPNGTITYMFPDKTGDELTPPVQIQQPEPDITSFCTPENPICSDIRSKDENEQIDQIMASHLHLYAGVFGDDLVVPDGDTIGVRSDTDELDVPLCTPRERVIHPEYGFSKDKRNLTIVNTDNYKQGVRVEYCEYAQHPCSELSQTLGYPTECKQMYHTRTLLAIDLNTGTPYKEQFVLPSCCKCVKKSLDAGISTARRIGF